ncbi:MAG: S9 family peptidase [Bdellovibrionaceae bacterium]|nr:S9 family peptidase [Pseudobdellovibrionaceae bacterium]
MKTLLILFFLWASWAFAGEEKLTIERLFQSPELDGSAVVNLQFSPNGQRLSFLKPKTEDYEVLDLWEFDLKSGVPKRIVDSSKLKFGTLSEEEKARRERQRISQKGIVEYYWSNDGQSLIFPAAGELYLYDIGQQQLSPLVKGMPNVLDVRFSPKDSYISFVHNQNLLIINPKTSKVYPVTKGGKGAISYGVAEFVAQEEMSRFTGYWWSNDERFLALTKVDESDVKLIERYDIDADKVVVRQERYPEAGSANAVVQLAVIATDNILKGKTELQWVPLGKNKDIYLTNAKWNSDNKLVYQVQSRDQKRLDVFSYDPVTRKNQLLFTETDKNWVNLHIAGRMLKKTARWIWISERTGFKHLYLYKNDGTLVRPLTKGDWLVDAIVGVDEDQGWVYFSAGMHTPLEKHLYRVRLEGESEPEPLTKTAGWHNTVMSEKADVFVDFFSTPVTPTQVFLRKANGDSISTLNANEVIAGHPLFPYKDSLVAPEFGTFKAATGELIYYSLFKPSGFKSNKKYPLIVIGYGGPTAQLVTKAWPGKRGLLAQVLVQKGYVVATFDNRGSSRRGKQFEGYLKNAFGTVEVEDQVAGVEYLVAKGFIDSKRVGFNGWSYGGFLALSLATKAPTVFQALVAGAPVTDFSLYDTHYTERYLGKPQDEAAAYQKANVLPLVNQIKANVLVIHGMADDNVLFTNSTLFFKKMQMAGKLYESVTYPGAKHGVYGKENQTHVYTSITDFFDRRL